MPPELVFVLLHGAWHTAHCWSKLEPVLTSRGYESIALSPHFSGGNPPTPDWNADLEFIRSTIEPFVKDSNVIVAMHSNAGMTGGTAPKGLDKAFWRRRNIWLRVRWRVS